MIDLISDFITLTLKCNLIQWGQSFSFQEKIIAMLEIRGLKFGYEETLVSNLSFTVKPGEMVLIHGPSGCGKSTLLSLISGTHSSDVNWTGKIMLFGEDISHRPPHYRSIGLMYQDPLLFPHLTVEENLAFGLAPSFKGRQRKNMITEALVASGLSGFEKRDPYSLSGGQSSRVALMRSLLAAPKALLLDEAFSGLDTALRGQFGQFVALQLQEKNIPAVLVSHNESDSEFTSGEILHLG